jgi:hypothetical protein
LLIATVLAQGSHRIEDLPLGAAFWISCGVVMKRSLSAI